MEYTIKFCVSCYLQHAVNMADGLLEKHAHDEGFTVRLMPGASGQFDVALDGKTLYSKQESGRLPTSEDIGSELDVTEMTEAGTDDDGACCC
ncbi:MAG: Rdx family protein [Nitrososphaerota archaeon]|jgi:selT/selW/selH-like putative selenoprotein|nr:Rdx family protein [Nitrososphaerota archaeon]MDG7039496.1 Rdx family protein [Nitrososphaerota archaeon]MDG7042815.1 Rdx family protein [Nitrososphaerota archaeon]MDG7045640.1 Rdx family protein [Nitrososphaerota archaeon]